VEDWARRHPEVALLLLSHPVNRGLGHARNTALTHARGEYVFVLDSDNAVYPNGIGDLVETLDRETNATFAYGILASFRDGDPYGLVSFFPWEPERLRTGNYIDAMALFRRVPVVEEGGYTTDRRLYGWEDYDLYCRLAEHAHRGVMVDRIVAMYRSSETSMLSVTNISHSSAFVALKEHAPTLMELVVIPD
jgi:glycosyltransferase involved in cell wall biosynthesis